MGIKSKRIIFIVLQILGIAWNLLCLNNIIESKFYAASIIWVFGFLLIITHLVPKKCDEKSNYIEDLTKQEKSLAISSLILGIAWLITIVSCMVY